MSFLKKVTRKKHFKNKINICTCVSYQVHWVNISILIFVIGQDLPEMRDVAGRQTQCVQLGEFGVRWYPRQGGFQPRKGFGEHAHAGPLPRVGCVPLHLLALLLRPALSRTLAGPRLSPLPWRIFPFVVCARSLAVGALLCALVGVFTWTEFQDAVQKLVVAERPGGHGGSSTRVASKHESESSGPHWEEKIRLCAHGNLTGHEKSKRTGLFISMNKEGVASCWAETGVLIWLTGLPEFLGP